MLKDSGARARVLARCALLSMLAMAIVLLVSIGDGGLWVIAVGLLGLVVSAAGVWWFLSRRGPVRLIGALLAALGPVVVFLAFLHSGLWAAALAVVGLWVVALAFGRAALRAARPPEVAPSAPAGRPRKPVLLMNPKSGGGKVGKFRLAERARALGAHVVMLDPAVHADVAALARQAVADGADLLGVAGGDGTQALVAEVAAEHDLPFLVISAGTRNHFAMDLGLDRADPSRCLDALTDGEELRIDLGDVAGRAFVNTVSFGVYADVVQRPEYRDAKTGTALGAIPELLTRDVGERLDALADERRLAGQQALLVSNNPYAQADPLAAGRRPQLDRGELGVIAIRVENAAQAAELAVRGAQSIGLNILSARRIEVTAQAERIPVAVDGEALMMPPPVICTVRPGALRVLVPRDRPGTAAAATPLDWRRVLAIALNRSEGSEGENSD